MRGPRGYIELAKLISKNLRFQKLAPQETSDLIKNHFEYWSEPMHINKLIFTKTLEALQGKPAVIVETGTSAWGTDSTRLWDSYIRAFGGSLLSVDIRPEASTRLKWQLSGATQLFIDDSVDFLKSTFQDCADLFFLDSWDLDLSDPFPSAQHGFNEYLAIKERLSSGNLLLIDDTPCALRLGNLTELPPMSQKFIEVEGALPGKGALILKDIGLHFNHEIVFHDYALLIKILGKKNGS
jgi:hypothetical protein